MVVFLSSCLTKRTEGAWKKEINHDNPLGHNGVMADQYAQLLKNMYVDNNSTFAPRNFKNTIARFQPQFAGYGQQDSQEFMSFLVDGLHEDLNRILKKPYTEYPDTDSSTVNNPAAIKELADKFREIHRSRNSSVIMDLFNGFYKNKLVCPVCDKVSITFDPYSLLTLQLPIVTSFEFSFTFVPLRGKPYIVNIDNEKGSTMRAIKEFVASRFEGTDPDRLLLLEIFNHKVYRTLEDRMSVPEASIQPRDEMFIYELDEVPTNYPPKQKYRSMLEVDAKPEEEDPDKETHQLVTVLHRVQEAGSYSLTLWPTFITLNKEEVSDYNEIYRKVLRASEVQTTASSLLEDEDAEAETPKPEDSVDEDSDGNAIKTRSIASEDYVDISSTLR